MRPVFICRFVLQPQRLLIAAPRRQLRCVNGLASEKFLHLFPSFLLVARPSRGNLSNIGIPRRQEYKRLKETEKPEPQRSRGVALSGGGASNTFTGRRRFVLIFRYIPTAAKNAALKGLDVA